MISKILLGVLLVIVSLGMSNPYSDTEMYIAQYYELAIEEMNRSGIPASIKLAQGIYESGSGTSDLSLGANNHFGIKCKKTWAGPTFYKVDDDRDRAGKLIRSCFRAYGSVEDSYRDHSDFLSSRPRYSALFNYDVDYKKWANGLQSSGYATNPNYTKALIKIIEKNQLTDFDLLKK